MNIQDILAGGPGSGCHGPNCGRPLTGRATTAKALGNMLIEKSKGKVDSLSHQVQKGNLLMASAGLDHRFVIERPLNGFSLHDKLSIHPLAVANYNEKHALLQLRKDADANDYMHEFGHHVDIAFVRAGGKGIDSEVARQVIDDYTSEYKAARERVSEALGHKFNFTKDYEKMAQMNIKGLPSHYAVDSSKEWFAECFYLYCKGGSYRDRLSKVAPKTTAAIKTVLRGGIFK